jgi:hypothetical protein
MRFWLVTCAVLFVAAQFILWLKHFLLPLPIAIFAGAFLSIASNYEKGIFSPFLAEKPPVETTSTISQTASLIEDHPLLAEEKEQT